MADIFDRDHLPKDKAVQSKLIRWILLHHAWSSAFLCNGHPFQTLHCRNPTEISRSSQEDSGTLYFNHRRTSNNVNSIMWGVREKKKRTKNKTEHYARVFNCCDEYLTLFDPQKVGKKAQPMSFTSSSSLCYTFRKKDILYMSFHIDTGLGIYQGFDLG